MGGWNETCCITNLPIKRGERVVVFPLVDVLVAKNRYEGELISNVRTSNIDDLYVPYYFPILGEYNDYGGIKKVEKDEYLLNYFNKLKLKRLEYDFEVENGKSKEIKKEDILRFEDDEDLFSRMTDLINRNGLVMNETYVLEQMHRNCFNYDRRCEMMIVKREIYELIVKEIGNRRVSGKNFRKLITDKFDGKLKEYKVDKENQLKEYGYIVDARLKNYIYWINFDRNLEMILDEYMRNKDEFIREKFVDLSLFAYGLNLLRKGWLVHSGKGSNDSEYKLHAIIAKEVGAIIKRHKKEYEEENYGDWISEEEIFWVER